MKTIKKEKDNAKGQAKAQLESIKEMVAALDVGDDAERCEAQETIQQDALCVEVRSDWHEPGGEVGISPCEYTILLCTGGPACRIIGNLTEHNEPETARIEYQDWGTPWTEYRLTSEEEATVLRYAGCFYFGD